MGAENRNLDIFMEIVKYEDLHIGANDLLINNLITRKLNKPIELLLL